jgi:membrane dipeptidase
VPEPPYRYPVGLSRIDELPAFRERLHARGYGAAEVSKIFGGNLMRVFREVWRDGR